MGGGKVDQISTQGKSDREMSFCQAFMLELYRHIGSNVDIQWDIGVGTREISYFRLTKKYQTTLPEQSLVNHK